MNHIPQTTAQNQDPPVEQPGGTAAALLRAARELFAEEGYRGASVRHITGRAGANLGAVTYHFGSKEALYRSVLEGELAPLRARLVAASRRPGPALDRIEAVVRAHVQHLAENPVLRRLMLHLLASGLPVPQPARRTVSANVRLLAELIEIGQRQGDIREGDPVLLALSVGAQPLVLNFARPALEQGGVLDPDDRAVLDRIIENAVRFVRRGLTVSPREDETPREAQR